MIVKTVSGIAFMWVEGVSLFNYLAIKIVGECLQSRFSHNAPLFFSFRALSKFGMNSKSGNGYRVCLASSHYSRSIFRLHFSWSLLLQSRKRSNIRFVITDKLLFEVFCIGLRNISLLTRKNFRDSEFFAR